MSDPQAIITVGLGFGDEGKGSIVDFLCRQFSARSVLRYNGGPQAAHHVVLKDGTWHCFSQFGSGTFVPGVRTHLSRQMLVKPSNLLVERDVLLAKGQQDALARLTIDPRAGIVTPMHGLLCRLQEMARGDARFGSVGMGVGRAAADRHGDPHALTIGDLSHERVLTQKLSRHYATNVAEARDILAAHPRNASLKALYDREMRIADFDSVLPFYRDFSFLLEKQLLLDDDFFAQNNGAPIVLEGAQGVLLDCAHGFLPYVTKTDVTLSSARAALAAAPRQLRATTIGILRAYSTRHGAGPFPAHDKALSMRFKETHNGTNPWQGHFRMGHFDLLMAKYGLEIAGGVDSLAITCLDRVASQDEIHVCTAYRYEGSPDDVEGFFDFREEKDGVRLTRIRRQASENKQKRLAALLVNCRPAEFCSFRGTEPFVSFLESKRGLETPVSVLSFGPVAHDKIMRAHRQVNAVGDAALYAN